MLREAVGILAAIWNSTHQQTRYYAVATTKKVDPLQPVRRKRTATAPTALKCHLGRSLACVRLPGGCRWEARTRGLQMGYTTRPTAKHGSFLRTWLVRSAHVRVAHVECCQYPAQGLTLSCSARAGKSWKELDEEGTWGPNISPKTVFSSYTSR
jgi:hypothetical protein